MPGVYIHIPFCKQACHYCNFHFSTSLRHRSEMVDAIVREMDWRKDYLQGAELGSVYFGGGTPSILSEGELGRIFEHLYRHFRIKEEAEVTLEANPDDLTQEKLKSLRHTPVNRLSIGVQSFQEEDLRFFNRAHNAIEARACIEYAQDLGFENLSIDLIYGSPTMTDAAWEKNLQIAFDYEIPHVSSYALTVEERTALHHFIKSGKAPEPDEEQTVRQFEFLMRAMKEQGYEHYEISNFARNGWIARHNSSYWQGEHYLGLGPSAHSFDGESRQWNAANNARYMKAVASLGQGKEAETDEPLFEREALTLLQRYNEYVMTGLRTKWGCKLVHIPDEFRGHFLEQVQPFLRDGAVTRKGDGFFLTDRGKLIADRVSLNLFL